VGKEGVVALQRTGMSVVRWMCGIGLGDRLLGGELGERLGVDDMALVLQQGRLRWCGRVLRGEDDGWVGKCVECGVEDPGPEGDLERGCQGELSGTWTGCRRCCGSW